jgi:hypothetical protein
LYFAASKVVMTQTVRGLAACRCWPFLNTS